jgi:hypothetical protein
MMQSLSTRYRWSATKTRWIASIAGFVASLLFLTVVGIVRSDGAVIHRHASPKQFFCTRTDPCGTTSIPDWRTGTNRAGLGHSDGYRGARGRVSE